MGSWWIDSLYRLRISELAGNLRDGMKLTAKGPRSSQGPVHGFRQLRKRELPVSAAFWIRRVQHPTSRVRGAQAGEEVMRFGEVFRVLSFLSDPSPRHCSGQLPPYRSGLTLKALLPGPSLTAWLPGSGLTLTASLLTCCCSGLKIVLRSSGYWGWCLSCFRCLSVPPGTGWQEEAAKRAIAFSYQRTSKVFCTITPSNRWRFSTPERAPNDARADGSLGVTKVTVPEFGQSKCRAGIW